MISRTFSLLTVSVATLLGNWVGGLLRFLLTGEEVQSIQFKYTTQKGRQMTNSPVASKFYPGLLFAFLGKPRWFFGFLGGVLTGSFVPDYLESLWLERVIEPLIVDRVSNRRGS